MRELGTYHYEHRVRYRECDPMGIVYHAHYLDYFEAARTEALRQTGISYRSVEESGIFMPVLDLKVKYIRPAYYDDLLIIACTAFLSESGVQTRFDYQVRRRDEKEILTEGSVRLCFFDRKRGRPVAAPDWIREKLGTAGDG